MWQLADGPHKITHSWAAEKGVSAQYGKQMHRNEIQLRKALVSGHQNVLSVALL
jgi:hypothetical protein